MLHNTLAWCTLLTIALETTTTSATSLKSFDAHLAHRRNHRLHSRNQTTTRTTQARTASKGYKHYNVVDKWQGANFFDGWNFYSDSDPTHGLVDYVDQGTAIDEKLAYVEPGGVAVMKVDNGPDLPNGTPRKSVRISSQKSYDGGLFIIDVASMPFGCAVWPAFWTLGPNWPTGGEIDILEGVHNGPVNAYTAHTSPGCTTDTSNPPPGFIVDPAVSTATTTNCDTSVNYNTGCGWTDKKASTYGSEFNAGGGGVLAMQWTDEGIRIWNFARNEIPWDITACQPNPDSWSSYNLRAAWAASTCSTSQYFKQHVLVFDITLCGDWAGATYESAGCPGTCAERVMKGSNFNDAAWRINSVAVFE